jgi:glycine dehydrogenase subunit 1
MDYTSISPDQRDEMLETIGVESVDELFAVIPEEARLNEALDLPEAASELEIQREVAALSGKNFGASHGPCFIGGGAYDHFVPAFIDQMISRGEFLTAYTPYQGEASQGSLQAFFEFQTQIARLTGLEIANASLYEGASATSEAAILALNITGKRRVLVADSIHPDHMQVLETVLAELPAELVVLPTSNGTLTAETVTEHADSDVAALIVQSPNVRGLIEDWEGCFGAVKDASEKGKEPMAVAVFNPFACGLLRNPGSCGADVATGEGQPLGIPLQLGGPYLGLFAGKKSFMRKMPGRLVGQTLDNEGRRTFCLSLQTREQHIRGEKATSNICTNQGLLALRATMFMTAIGPTGLREMAEQCWHKAHDLAKRIDAIDGFSRADAGEFFNEFVVRCPVPARQVIDAAREAGLLAGIAMDSPRLNGIGSENELLIAVTEKRTKSEMDGLVACLEGLAR